MTAGEKGWRLEISGPSAAKALSQEAGKFRGARALVGR